MYHLYYQNCMILIKMQDLSFWCNAGYWTSAKSFAGVCHTAPRSILLRWFSRECSCPEAPLIVFRWPSQVGSEACRDTAADCRPVVRSSSLLRCAFFRVRRLLPGPLPTSVLFWGWSVPFPPFWWAKFQENYDLQPPNLGKQCLFPLCVDFVPHEILLEFVFPIRFVFFVEVIIGQGVISSAPELKQLSTDGEVDLNQV